MAKVLTFTQQKGGAGKTSLAVHLGTYWAHQGKSVALVDGDPQGSLMAWSAMRSENGAASDLVVEKAEGWKAATVVANLAKSHDYVLIDTAPHAETASRTAAREADLVVVPMQPSPLDLWATDGSMEMVEAEKKASIVVLNRVPPRSSLADDVTEKAVEKGLSVAKARLGNRTAFAASFMAGKGISEFSPRSKAADEIKALAQEIGRKLAKL